MVSIVVEPPIKEGFHGNGDQQGEGIHDVSKQKRAHRMAGSGIQMSYNEKAFIFAFRAPRKPNSGPKTGAEGDGREALGSFGWTRIVEK